MRHIAELLQRLCLALNLPLSYFFESDETWEGEAAAAAITRLTSIIDEQRKRIDYLTDLLLELHRKE